MNIGHIARRRVVTINFVEPVARALFIMQEQGLRHLPVLRNLTPAGMVTDHNVLNHIGWLDPRHKHVAMNDRVEKIMRSPLIVVAPEESIPAVAQIMVRKNAGAIPLQEGQRLVGIATKSDLLKCFAPGQSVFLLQEAEECVESYMAKDVLHVAPEDATADALHTMKVKRIQHLPVMHAGKLVGMLSDRDILRGSPKAGGAMEGLQSLGSKLKVRGLMTSKVVSLSPKATLREAAERMLQLRIGALPVCVDDQLIGILSETDLIKVLAGPMPADRTFQF